SLYKTSFINSFIAFPVAYYQFETMLSFGKPQVDALPQVSVFRIIFHHYPFIIHSAIARLDAGEVVPNGKIYFRLRGNIFAVAQISGRDGRWNGIYRYIEISEVTCVDHYPTILVASAFCAAISGCD